MAKIFKGIWTFGAVFSLLLTALLASGAAGGLGHRNGGFRGVGLQIHNDYRERYGYKALELSTELNKIAHNHAEYLANSYQFTPSTAYGAKQNMWAHQGELRTISLDVRDAVICWFTGLTPSGKTIFEVKPNTLYSPDVHWLGIGVGTNADANYTVVVANYM